MASYHGYPVISSLVILKIVDFQAKGNFVLPKKAHFSGQHPMLPKYAQVIPNMQKTPFSFQKRLPLGDRETEAKFGLW